jgi:uncharacterized protein YcbK (DUF882 family)
MKLSKNFNKSEFDCKCNCEMPKDVLYNIQKVANQLQIIRDRVNVPVKVNSAYRCLKHNKSIGSNDSSQHPKGNAVDVVIQGYKPNEVADLIEQLISDGDILQGGLGRYNTFSHYDIGYNGRKRRWDNRK